MDQAPQARRPVRRAGLLIAALLCFSACAAHAPSTGGSSPAEPHTARLRVANNTWSDLTIYAVHGGSRTRIGSVESLGSREFRLSAPIVAVGRVQLYAELLAGGGAYQAPPISLRGSDRVELILENQLALSSVLLSSR